MRDTDSSQFAAVLRACRNWTLESVKSRPSLSVRKAEYFENNPPVTISDFGKHLSFIAGRVRKPGGVVKVRKTLGPLTPVEMVDYAFDSR